ncbi:hypothetical protein D3C74_376570 [compost metagenome]
MILLSRGKGPVLLTPQMQQSQVRTITVTCFIRFPAYIYQLSALRRRSWIVNPCNLIKIFRCYAALTHHCLSSHHELELVIFLTFPFILTESKGQDNMTKDGRGDFYNSDRKVVLSSEWRVQTFFSSIHIGVLKGIARKMTNPNVE